MTKEIHNLIAELKALREELKPSPPSFYDRTLHILEKLVIPVMLGFLAWVGSQAATKIAEGQLHLAENTADHQKLESRRSMQAKFIEMFYKDLNSGDPASQMNAVRLVRLIDADLAQSLLTLVATTPGISQAVVAKANEAKRQAENISPLSSYKIGIYYPSGNFSATPTALRIEESLREAGFNGIIQKYPSDPSFIQKVNAPVGLEIRFEPGIEDDAADALLSIVQTVDTKGRWSKRPVSNRTPGFISVFLPNNS
jgi:hypothetical protein